MIHVVSTNQKKEVKQPKRILIDGKDFLRVDQVPQPHRKSSSKVSNGTRSNYHDSFKLGRIQGHYGGVILDSSATKVKQVDEDDELLSRSDMQIDRAYHNSSGTMSRNVDNRGATGTPSIG